MVAFFRFMFRLICHLPALACAANFYAAFPIASSQSFGCRRGAVSCYSRTDAGLEVRLSISMAPACASASFLLLRSAVEYRVSKRRRRRS